MPCNMLWNIEIGQAIMIDFKRAEIVKLRAVLGVILPDAKIPCSHPVCKESHARTVYKIKHWVLKTNSI